WRRRRPARSPPGRDAPAPPTRRGREGRSREEEAAWPRAPSRGCRARRREWDAPASHGARKPARAHARRRPPREPWEARSLELLPERLLDLLGMRATARLLHGLPHEEREGPLLARAHLRHGSGIGRDDLARQRAQRILVVDREKAL